MPQPAEAQQGGFPILGRRFEVENGAGVTGDDLAREYEAARINFGGAGGVGCTKVMWCDGQAVGAAGP